MRIESIEIRDLRCLSSVSLSAASDGAWIEGPNGAGKTSVLEALCLLGFGRSFRGRVGEGLVRQGATAVEVVARWVDALGRAHTSGLRHEGSAWQARRDGSDVASLGELAAGFPVLCFHPASSQLVTGAAEERRRALDWLAFHVEPSFSSLSRRYQRAWRQRNALLRAGASDAEFEAWEVEMSLTAEALTAQRQSVRSLWQPALARLWSSLADGAVAPELNLRPGWRVAEAPLADWLLLNRPRDRELGYTTIGPHRAELSLGSPFGVGSEQLSRGQAKLVALALQLAQAEALKDWTGERSVILLDDLQAELDPLRQLAVLGWLREQGYQAWVTGTRVDEALSAQTPTWQRFHVEQGVLTQA